VLEAITMGFLYGFGGAFGWSLGHGAIALITTTLGRGSPAPAKS
jgi:hypothetical protein